MKISCLDELERLIDSWVDTRYLLKCEGMTLVEKATFKKEMKREIRLEAIEHLIAKKKAWLDLRVETRAVLINYHFWNKFFFKSNKIYRTSQVCCRCGKEFKYKGTVKMPFYCINCTKLYNKGITQKDTTAEIDVLCKEVERAVLTGKSNTGTLFDQESKVITGFAPLNRMKHS